MKEFNKDYKRSSKILRVDPFEVFDYLDLLSENDLLKPIKKN
jgi:hypothetical protein